MTRPPLVYRLASLGLAVPLAGYTLARTLRDGGGIYLRERYGFAPHRQDRPVWVHCASVGEVAAALPLLAELQLHGIGPLLLSTATPTGRARARGRVPAGTDLVYLPLDRPGPVRRFVARTRPRAALVLETELWPHLFAAVAGHDIPLALVNGRLSSRTLAAPHWWRRSAGWCLGRVTRVLARSASDRDRFLALGADPARVAVTGNLKFAQPGGATATPIDPGLAFVLAASTHEDEELQLARAWARADTGDHLLVIAPRHPERGPGIAASLRREGFTVRLRSKHEAPADPTDIYIADTLGELAGLIEAARVVIMGGSLIPHGGQNVLEPARAGRPVVTGPHMGNFADETDQLEQVGALLRTTDATAAITATVELLRTSERRADMGQAGQTLLREQADMATRYREALVAAIPALMEPVPDD